MNMETITYSQVKDLIKQLPAQKLPLVYNLLIDLTTEDKNGVSPQQDFIRLPLSERRQIMAQQAAQMLAHYEQTAAERQAWQGGDFSDEY
jgi:hypothetical protein